MMNTSLSALHQVCYGPLHDACTQACSSHSLLRCLWGTCEQPRLRRGPAEQQSPWTISRTSLRPVRCSASAAAVEVQSEADITGMEEFLDSLKWDANGLVAAICQACLLD